SRYTSGSGQTASLQPPVICTVLTGAAFSNGARGLGTGRCCSAREAAAGDSVRPVTTYPSGTDALACNGAGLAAVRSSSVREFGRCMVVSLPGFLACDRRTQ